VRTRIFIVFTYSMLTHTDSKLTATEPSLARVQCLHHPALHLQVASRYQRHAKIKIHTMKNWMQITQQAIC